MLSDVVVIGYGTQRKSDLTGSVTNVSSEDFNTGLVSSPEQLINGKISGVQIMSNSGSPTAGSTIRVRGGASLNASNDPLIVLDGVPLEQGGISGNDGNFLSLINPNDIESMTILKDASSTAIYGSRASNGVIIITTKKGNSDKLKVTFSTTNSIQTRTRMADMLSYDQFVNVVKTQGSAAQQALLGTANTDWNDQVYHNAFGTDNNLSLAGRIAPNWPIRVSVGYYNQDGLLKTDNAERFTGSLSLSPSFFDDHLKLTINAKGSLNKNQFANTSAIWGASTMNPTIPVYSGTDAFGGFTEAITGDGSPVTGGVRNPVGLLEQRDAHSKVVRFIGNFDVDYRLHFFPDLKLHATLGYDYAEGKGSEYVSPEAAQYYTTGGYYYPYGPQKNENRLLTLYANYNKFVDTLNSSFDATVGYDYQYWKSATPATTQMNAAGEIQTQYRASDQRHVLLSYYGRLNYSYGSRYMLTATVRRDATSRFAQSQRWGTFPSLSLGWRMSDEVFMEKTRTWLDDLKVRAGYGTTGNSNIGAYNYAFQYATGNDYLYGITGADSGASPGYAISNLGDVNAKWETTKMFNVGLDVTALNNRLTGSIDYYIKKTSDLLVNANWSALAGNATKPKINIGDMQNKGLDFSVGWRDKVGDFSYSVNANISTYKNKVTQLGSSDLFTNTRLSKVNITTVGQPVAMFYGYQVDGIYTSEQDVLNYKTADGKTILPYAVADEASLNPQSWVGRYKIRDVNGDGKIGAEDRTIIGNPHPDFTGGVNLSVGWKGFDLSTFLYFSVGNDLYKHYQYYTHFGALQSNFSKDRLENSWDPVTNPDGIYPLWAGTSNEGTEAANESNSTYIEDGSYLRMQTLTLGYTLPKSILNKIKFEKIRVYGQVSNVFTLTGYSGLDPEVRSNNEDSSNDMMKGIDYGSYGMPRQFILGVNISF